MDDLVVIILTLIVAGVGALSQLKKKKQAAGNAGQHQKSPDFWGLLEDKIESAGQEDNSEYYEEEQMEPVAAVEISLNKLKKKRDNRSVVANNLVKEMNRPKLKSKLKEDFSLRKAVIYSEILNRKYI